MPETPLCRIFGVRHLSPAAAVHLRDVLEEMQPTAVLVEGPSDGTDQIKHLIHAETKPPLAVLSYTKARPIRSILGPLASYSPEWVALTWGIEHGAETRFMDLPSSVFLAEEFRPPQPEKKDATPDDPPKPEEPEPRNPYKEMAELAGESDHETWWERTFEHTVEAAAYSGPIDEYGRGLRTLSLAHTFHDTEVREAFMRRTIHDTLKRHAPEKILVVCGAAHSSTLIHELPAMTDDELAKLPHTDVSLTLMPYSYYRLSSQSGYGAGNRAPAYFERIYRHLVNGSTADLPAEYLTELAGLMRRAGKFVCSADIIEAVRLASQLAALKQSSVVTLNDLRDAAVTCMARGEVETIREVLVDLDVGTAVGHLPKGIARTSIQDDFYSTLESLQLNKYQTEQAQELGLDLRENRYVKSSDLAFRDLNRSTFFHRLNVLGITFPEMGKARQRWTTWKEVWKLRWTPDSEIQLVENALVGDTVEQAAALKLNERLAKCDRIDHAAELVRVAANCALPDAVAAARDRLQALAVDATNFVQLAGACSELADLIRYGSVRKVEPEPLKPLLAQLFLRATLGLPTAAMCDDESARQHVAPALIRLVDVGREHCDDVDEERWRDELDRVATQDHFNAYLSGFVMSIIQPRLPEDRLTTEIRRRLSLGNPPDVTANWVEGLMHYNREALLQRQALWRELDAYLCSLTEPEFRTALVPLRRAFGSFAPGQVRRVVSNLVEISADGAEALKESLDTKFSDAETEQLRELLSGFKL